MKLKTKLFQFKKDGEVFRLLNHPHSRLNIEENNGRLEVKREIRRVMVMDVR